ncbi:MAG: ABC transporter permease [Candidatus Coatesbacteria bacterium]|nr:ABC transporter permease [Candidatus Coatesbacteria bacterium]
MLAKPPGGELNRILKPSFKRAAIRNVRTVIARSYVRVVGANRETSWLIGDTVLPLLTVSAFVMVYKSFNAPQEFIGYVVLGGVMSAYWLAMLWSMAMQFYWEKEMGNLELYTMAPMSLMSILAGMVIGGLFMTSVRAFVILLAGSLIFGVDYSFQQPFLAAGVFIFTLFALYGLGLMFSSIFFLVGRRGWQIMNLFEEPVFFASGFYFPVRTLGATVPFFTSFIPITLGLDAMRQLAFSEDKNMGFLNPELEFIILIALTFIFIVVAKFLLNYMEKLGARTGRILQRWQ